MCVWLLSALGPSYTRSKPVSVSLLQWHRDESESPVLLELQVWLGKRLKGAQEKFFQYIVDSDNLPELFASWRLVALISKTVGFSDSRTVCLCWNSVHLQYVTEDDSSLQMSLKRDTFVLHGFGFFFFFQNFITKEETVPVLTIHLHEQSLNVFSTWSYPGHQVVFNCPASIPSYYNNSLVFLGTTSSICIHVV